VAERHAAVHAARGLLAAVARIKCLFHFAEIMYSVVHGAVSRLFAMYCQKSFIISHDGCLFVFNSYLSDRRPAGFKNPVG
jgi:hypothetical protein